MNFLKKLFGRKEVKILKRKIEGITIALEETVSSFTKEVTKIRWWGAYDIDPKHLVFCIGVNTDKLRDELRNNKKFNEDLREILERFSYPEKSRKFVSIIFESQETVGRESDGNWFFHFK